MALPQASYAPDLDDAARLLEQAARLDEAARRKREEASELAREAIELRLSADAITREPARILSVDELSGRRRERAPSRPASVDTRFLDRIVDALQAGPMTMGEVAEHIGASTERTRKGMLRLVAVGSVSKSGATRATRYALVECAEEAPAAPATPVHLRVLSTTHPTARELHDREVAWSTAAPVVDGAMPERDDDA